MSSGRDTFVGSRAQGVAACCLDGGVGGQHGCGGQRCGKWMEASKSGPDCKAQGSMEKNRDVTPSVKGSAEGCGGAWLLWLRPTRPFWPPHREQTAVGQQEPLPDQPSSFLDLALLSYEKKIRNGTGVIQANLWLSEPGL